LGNNGHGFSLEKGFKKYCAPRESYCYGVQGATMIPLEKSVRGVFQA
jgi:hypothetical protein